MEGIAQNGKGDVPLFHQPQQPPEVRVQNGVAASDIEIRQAAGFSSGFSEAPQAEPQAEATFSSVHPARLESAIVMSSFKYSDSLRPL